MSRFFVASRTSIACFTLFASCTAFLAQTSQPPTSPKPKLDEFTTEGTRQCPTSGALDVLTDTQGIDFGPYLQNVVGKVRKNWYAIIPPDLETKKGRVAIELSIARDGSLEHARIASGSGDESLDRPAQEAIERSFPVSPLAVEFKGDRLALRFRFYYNPDREDLVDDYCPASPPSLPPLPTPPLVVLPEATTRVEEIEVVSKTGGMDVRSYLDSNVLPLLRANWYRLLSKSGEKTAGDATVQFDINKDGSVGAVSLTDGAGHVALGDLATKAVTRSGPFASLPTELSIPSLTLRTRFEFEPRSDAMSGCDGQAKTCVVPPRVIFSPPPQVAKGEARQLVTVTLKLVVTAEGSPQNIKVLKSTDPDLDAKAIEAVQKWKFEPATKDGKPVATEIQVEVDFKLH